MTKRKDRKKHWARKIINDSMCADRRKLDEGKYEEIDWTRYITREYLEKVVKALRGRCFWCNILLSKTQRHKANGLTVERLTSNPHYVNECTIACKRCNCMSWRKELVPWSQREGPVFPKEGKLHCFQMYLKEWQKFQVLLTSIRQFNRGS